MENEPLLAQLAGQRDQIGRAFNKATGEDYYSLLRNRLRNDPAFVAKVRTYWGLPDDYPVKSLQVHHKVFLKGLEPYFFKFEPPGSRNLVMRSQDEITYIVTQLKKKGYDLGNTKGNMIILPKELHQKDLLGSLSTHTILGKYFDIQGGGAEMEFEDVVKKEGPRPGRELKYGRQKGEGGASPFYRQITDSQIGMSERRASRIFQNNNLDKLVEEMKGQLKQEVPKMKGAIAAAAFVSNAPDEVKKEIIAEYGGPKGEYIDEMLIDMRQDGGRVQREIIRQRNLLARGLDETGTAYGPRVDLAKKEQELVARLDANQRLQEKIAKDSVPYQRELGFHRADSPALRRLRRKTMLQLGSAVGVAGVGLLSSEAGHAMSMEDWEKNPTALNAAQTWLTRGELAGEGLTAAGAAATGTVLGAPVGLAMMGVGEAVSNVAGWTDVGIDVYENRDAIWEAVSKKENQEWFIDKATKAETYRQLGGSAARAIYNAPGNIVGYYKDRLNKEEEEEPIETSINYGEWQNQ